MTSLSIKIAFITAIVLLLVLLSYIFYIYGFVVPIHPASPGIVQTSTEGLPYNYNNYTTHPYLLFHDITQTPGYQNGNTTPWSGWEAAVLNSANASMSMDFYSQWAGDYVSFRAENASTLALAYQITKNASYAQQAENALMNLDVGGSEDVQMNITQLLNYCLAYDWVQPYLSSSADMTIRDKLATLSDNSYKALNGNNTTRNYIETVDYMMEAYPVMSIAGITLSDYTNPNHLPLSSTPQDWQLVGTQYLFVDDALHNYNRSLVSFQWDPTGKDLLGSYKEYYTPYFMWWAQIYTYYYGQNFFNAYPIAKDAFTSELWESLPNTYSNDFVTNGNVIYSYQGAFENLLDPADQSAVNYHLSMINSSLLPYSRTMIPLNDAGPGYLYLTYQGYANVTPVQPSTTSHLNSSSVYQVFRGSWSNDSEWLGMVTDDINTLSNRNNAHNDQLSFEYYGKGDLLLASAGENRHILDKDYGAYEIDQNTVGIDDPRHPFSIAPWSNTRTRGIFKGSSNGLVTPSNILSVVDTQWMQFVDANVTVTQVIQDSKATGMPLSSPIDYERCILFPDNDYFIVVDRLQGSETWTYHNFFRPTSLSIVPTIDTNGDSNVTENDVGHVNGSLEVGSTAFDWLDNSFQNNVPTGENTSLIKWFTTNPYGNNVELQIYTVPSSDVSVGKYTTRIAGYEAPNEVYSPVLDLESGPENSLYRATVLLANYTDEAQRVPSTLAVSGDGNAIEVNSSGNTDYIYTGEGSSSFGPISTDADILFVRDNNGPGEYTMINGTSVEYNGMPLVKASDLVDYLTLKQSGTDLTFQIQVDKDMIVRLFPQGTMGSYSVTMDGSPYTSASSTANGGIAVSVPAGEHTFKING
jgi:hypothetical protein